ncbi:MAG TPA: TetR/AcrR family transcriptional regulator [Candidatus Limnocylindria bacterium]|nr:TetR/AcrR family transcriptional regulator [Candidatus Limnocylindria bacterium]
MTDHSINQERHTRGGDQTRDRIVQAAYRALLKQGYHQTSMKDIAAEAGVAPGLAHYYFESKEDLLVAVIERACLPLKQEWDAQRRLLGGEAPSPEQALSQALAGFQFAKEEVRRFLDMHRLVFDMFGVGLHNPRIAAAVARFINERREDIALVARAVVAASAVKPASDPEALAAAVWGAMNGIVLQKLMDPDFDSDAAINALSEMAFTLAAVPVPARIGEGRE